MTSPVLSDADRELKAAFESGSLPPAEFSHRAHVRLAYAYLTAGDVEMAVEDMRRGLVAYLGHHGIDPAKFHETLTRAWVLAVWHFMSKTPDTDSSDDLIARHPVLLDGRIMLTHYSAERLFSDTARSEFVEPDLDPIPRHPPRTHVGNEESGRMATGQCNCGAVQFEIDTDLSGVYVCHCSICRRSTGSNGIAVVVVPNERFRWVQGQQLIATWKKPDTSWQTWFCSVCGSPVPGENDATRMFAPAGCITQGGDALEVIHHIWVGSKAAWDEIGDAGQQHTEGFRG